MNKNKNKSIDYCNNIKSPCIGVCKLVGNNCIGCGRTSKEIQNWSKYNNAQKNAIINKYKNS